ncbi:MAG TPA: Na+/H+ antiporter subunit E [Pirellulaceae bacterium]|nr:Na+/H+ antiporter subunit E [Pirellulaceae bacterium]
MKLFLWNLLLALTWGVATGEFTPTNLVLGFGLGYLILFFAGRAIGPSPYFSKVPQVALFALFYLWQLIRANLRVAYDVMTPTHYMRPGVVAVPLDAKTDAEITTLANLITLTPGSLSVDLSPDRRVLYVHMMYIDDGDVEAARRGIKEDIERRVLEVMR